MGKPGDRLPGLWLPISLMLIVLIGGVLPFLGSYTGHAAYEFFKDWQTLITGIIALGAALWAALPVYRQLNETRVQSAIQTHQMLREYSFLLASERSLVGNLLAQVSVRRIYEDLILASEEFDLAGRPLARLEEWPGEFLQLANKFNEAGMRKWGNELTRALRDDVVRTAYAYLHYAQDKVVKMITGKLDIARNNANWRSVKAEIAAINIGDVEQAFDSSCRSYIQEIEKEDQRISPLLHRALAIVQAAT